jgi:hypothetical protein
MCSQRHRDISAPLGGGLRRGTGLPAGALGGVIVLESAQARSASAERPQLAWTRGGGARAQAAIQGIEKTRCVSQQTLVIEITGMVVGADPSFIVHLPDIYSGSNEQSNELEPFDWPVFMPAAGHLGQSPPGGVSHPFSAHRVSGPVSRSAGPRPCGGLPATAWKGFEPPPALPPRPLCPAPWPAGAAVRSDERRADELGTDDPQDGPFDDDDLSAGIEHHEECRCL